MFREFRDIQKSIGYPPPMNFLKQIILEQTNYRENQMLNLIEPITLICQLLSEN